MHMDAQRRRDMLEQSYEGHEPLPMLTRGQGARLRQFGSLVRGKSLVHQN